MTKRAVGLSVLEELRERITHFSDFGERLDIILFSTGGFTKNLEKVAEAEGIKLISF